MALKEKGVSPPVEDDSLRSTKKVRLRSIGEVDGKDGKQEDRDTEMTCNETEGMVSYRNKLLNLNQGGQTPRPQPEIELSETDFLIGKEGDIPAISFSDAIRATLSKGMERTLIIKLLGRSITFYELRARTQALWQLKGSFQLVNMEGSYFFATFDVEEDYVKALTGGPWMIFGAYLTVQPWSLDFDAKSSPISKVVAWVRIPGLSFRYYHKSTLRAIGSLLGDVVKIDYMTETRGRGKYARLAILMNLMQPLTPEGKMQEHGQPDRYRQYPGGIPPPLDPTSALPVHLEKSASVEVSSESTTERYGAWMQADPEGVGRDSSVDAAPGQIRGDITQSSRSLGVGSGRKKTYGLGKAQNVGSHKPWTHVAQPSQVYRKKEVQSNLTDATPTIPVVTSDQSCGPTIEPRKSGIGGNGNKEIVDSGIPASEFQKFAHAELQPWMYRNLVQTSTGGSGSGSWASLFGITCWKLWDARNKVIFQDSHTQPVALAREIRVLSECSMQASNLYSVKSNKLRRIARAVMWIKPHQGTVEDEVIIDIKEMIQDCGDGLLSLECCIYRVPTTLRHLKEEAYTPKVVSIGPFHHGNERLQNMERYKRILFKRFTQRAASSWHDLVPFVKLLEPKVCASYSETIKLSKEELVKLTLMDAGFIIALFISSRTFKLRNDAKLSQQWLRNSIRKDLLLIENQLPFFVIEELFNKAFPQNHDDRSFPSFLELAYGYFGYYNKQKLKPNPDVKIKHFTDLLRLFHLHENMPRRRSYFEEGVGTHLLLYKANALQEAGIKLKPTMNKCLLDLKLSGHILEIPQILVHENTELLFRNMIALEQCHYLNDAYISDYAFVMDWLIDTSKDVDLLVDKKIVRHSLGDSSNVASFFNGLLQNVIETKFNSEYIDICKGLNGYCEDPRNKMKATLRQDYCNTPWRTVASIAGIILLVLTIIQTIFSVLQVVLK
ncbi:hypothetical protein K1719_043791 [Acacia pycnantha]|nr:hypothetical protein K1719_043791 [Acacia pycnantha]